MTEQFEGVSMGEGVSVGQYCVIDPGVTVGDGVSIGSFVRIFVGTTIGAGSVIADHAVLGKRPQLAASSTAARTELPGLVLGERCKVGSHTVLMAGTTWGDDCVAGDRCFVRERCTLGDKVVVGNGATVENDTTIGSRTRIQTGAYVTAYMTIEEDVFIAPMVVTTNDNYMGRTDKRHSEMRGATIRRGARVGGGAHLLPGVEIGEDAFVATAAIVTKDVPAGTIVMGAPARVVREINEDERLENQ